jgi:hypothetical protein
MVALAITAGVVVTLVVSFNYQLGGASLSREDVIVASLGAQKLEMIKLEGIVSREGDFGEGYEGYSWTLVEEDSGLKGVKRLELKVVRKNGPPVSFVSYLQK